jgi:hypothetical protein
MAVFLEKLASQTLWAVVNIDGNLVRGFHATSAGRPSFYEVVFDRDVSACAYAATMVDPEGVSTGVMISASNRSHVGKPNSVFVQPSTIAGAVSVPFHLVVQC